MRRRSTPAPAEAAFVLVAVLWMLALLAGLATIYSAYARASAASSILPVERLRAEAAIRSAVELTAYNLFSAPAAERPSHGSFEFPLGAERVAVAFRPETARIDLNVASAELMTALLTGLGVKSERAAALAAEIVAWRKPAPQNARSPDVKAYRDAGLPYGPRQGPYEDTLELALLPGFDPELVERALPHLTVYSSAQTDASEADELVRGALAGSGQASASPAGPTAAAAPGPSATTGFAPPSAASPLQASPGAAASPALAGAAPQVFRATVTVATPHRRSIHAIVVFSLQEQGEDPYFVLLWRDDFDAPLGPA